MAGDEWLKLLQTDMDKLFVGRDQVKAEGVKLKKGERRNVTVLFLDLKGYTALSEKHDAEEMALVIKNVFTVLTGEIERYGGMVDKYMGDAIMALFGAKKASEDDAERSIRAALGMLGRMKQVNEILATKGIELGFRIGLNTGLVVAGEMSDRGERDFTVMGDAVNTASRLESAAQVNTIMISESTRAQAGDIFEYLDLEPIMVKGKSKPLKVYRVLGVMKDRVERWDRDTLAKSAKYVGRKSEWELLDSYLKKNFERAETTPVPVIGIRADGGMGKSRMVYEYLSHGSCPRGLILKGKAISYTAAPYWVLISLMKNMLEVSEGDSIEKIKAKWDALIGRLAAFPALPESERANAAASFKENEDYLAYLLGVARDPEQIRLIKPDKLKELIFNSFRIFLDAAASLPENGQALYLVLDDMHWIDELSRELIDYLMQTLRPACKTLIFAMFRPDYQVSSFWQKDKNYFEVGIEPLALEEATVMVEGMLRGLVLTENLKNLIYEKSGGNPFYVEEITYALVDRGVLIPDEEIQPGNRIWVVNPTEPSIELPDSVHGMVQTRIDKLEENERTLLYEASVIGMEFNTDLLTSLHAKAGGKSDGLEKALETLETARLMNEKIAQITPEGNYKKGYIFSNALVQEVAYNTLLNYNKQLLHGLLGECIEEIYSRDRIPEDEHYRLAYHFEKGDKADKAITYFESSADQCATRFSNKAAIDCYKRLLKMLEKSSRPKDEIDEIAMRNLYKLAQIEYRINSFDEAYGNYAECSKVCQERKNYDLLCRVLTRAGEIERIREKQDKAMRFFEKSLELAEKMGHDFYVADNLANIGIVLEERGDYAGAMQYFQKALSWATNDEQRQDISHYIFQRT